MPTNSNTNAISVAPSGSGSTAHWSLHQVEGSVDAGGPFPSSMTALTPSGSSPNNVSYNSTGWSVANGDASLIYNSTQKAYQIGQNGGYYGSPTLTCGNEYDMFISTLDNLSYPLNSAVPNVSKNLGQANSLNVSFYFSISNEVVNIPRCGNNPKHPDQGDFVGYLLTLILSNDAQNPDSAANQAPRQTMFYQVFLHDSRNISNTKNLLTGSVNTNPANTSATWIVNSTVDEFGAPLAKPFGARSFYSMNFLPNIQSLITNPKAYITQSICIGTSNGPGCWDNNLADWRVTNVYLGQAMQGNALGTSNWDSLNVIVN